MPDAVKPTSSSEPEFTPSASLSDSYKPAEPEDFSDGGTSASGFDAAPLSSDDLGGGSSSYVPPTPSTPIGSTTGSPGTYSGLGLTAGAPLAEEPGFGGATGRTTGNIGAGRTGGVPGEESPGVGGRSGAAEPTARGGAGAASEGAAGGRTAGAGGRSGAAGPMGAGRGAGKKDDKEHQRKFVATEELDDGLDTEETEQGTLTRDAEGNIVPPDVIGEQATKPAQAADGGTKPAKPEGLTGRPKESPEPEATKPAKPKLTAYRGSGD